MTGNAKTLAAEGLAFFGRMNAAISHDMKNVLAIILIHHTLNFAIASAGPEKRIGIAVKGGNGGGEIVFSGLAKIERTFPSEIAATLAQVLGVGIVVDAGLIRLIVPAKIPAAVELG